MSGPSLPIYFPTGSIGWLIVNVNWDVWLGLGAFLILTKGVPRLIEKARTITYPDSKTGKMREAPLHPKWFVLWAWITVLTLVVVLWGIFLTLVFSSGWHDPFRSIQWQQLPSMPGWFFDLVYARANDEPNGAHILSWLMPAGFGIAVWFRTVKRPLVHFRDILGDPYQGIAALVFMGGVHELLWVPFFYAAYAQYLSWSLLIPVLRDISFAFMMAMFILTWWRYPGRAFPLSKLKPIVLVYVVFLAAWFVLPYVFVGVWFPITTLNNPNFGVGPYQETPYFAWWGVNAIETAGWLLLCIPSIMLVWRHKG